MIIQGFTLGEWKSENSRYLLTLLRHFRLEILKALKQFVQQYKCKYQGFQKKKKNVYIYITYILSLS